MDALRLEAVRILSKLIEEDSPDANLVCATELAAVNMIAEREDGLGDLENQAHNRNDFITELEAEVSALKESAWLLHGLKWQGNYWYKPQSDGEEPHPPLPPVEQE